MSLPRKPPARAKKHPPSKLAALQLRRTLALSAFALVLVLFAFGAVVFKYLMPPESTAVEMLPAVATPAAVPIPTPAKTPTTEAPVDEQFMTASSRAAVARDEIGDPSSRLVVVNKQRPIEGKRYEPELVSVLNSEHQLHPSAGEALEKMFAAAADDGVQIRVLSAYRSYDRQYGSRNANGQKHSGAALDAISARPGFSEHQTGLVADVGMPNGQCELKACFADTTAGLWIQEHAADYGFIVRYPDGENDITGYIYEPWHLRFIGTATAEDFTASGAPTLEQYFGLPAAPDY